MVCQRGANTAWASAADGGLGVRRYVCQNWRADVSAILTDAGKMAEWVKYSSYGIPSGLPVGDTDSDGDWDATDAAAITGGYDVRKVADLNGTVDGTVDVNHANSILPGGGYQALGRSVMTSTGVMSRKGYAGYELDPSLWGTADKGRTFWHGRHRVLDSGLGRWVQRDPAGYVDGAALYAYAGLRPLHYMDTSGLCASCSQDAPSRCLGTDSCGDPHAPCSEVRVTKCTFTNYRLLVMEGTGCPLLSREEAKEFALTIACEHCKFALEEEVLCPADCCCRYTSYKKLKTIEDFLTHYPLTYTNNNWDS